ncbi:MAG: outer membrane beta-barrel protein, partial [Pseudomonadota bacterium]|nr:outer membrane beta-barrel protein [Pseudomonadota bacterium]
QIATWSGPYFGGHIGGTQVDDDGETVQFDTNLDGGFNDTVSTAAGADAFSPGFCAGPTVSSLPGSCLDDEAEFEVGLRAGYDQQFGSFVVGGLVELTGTRIEDSASAFSTTPAFYTFTRELEGMVALRGRAGFAFDRFLAYVTGGYARGDLDQTFTTSNNVNSVTQRGESEASGYQVGAGAEAQVAERLSLGLEYLFTSLDDDTRVRLAGPAPATNPFIRVNPAGTDFRRSKEEFDFHSVRVVANVRF